MAKRKRTIASDFFAPPSALEQNEQDQDQDIDEVVEDVPVERVRPKRVQREEPVERPPEPKEPKKRGRTVKPMTTQVSIEVADRIAEIAEAEGWTEHSVRKYALSLFIEMYDAGKIPQATVKSRRKTLKFE